MYYFKFAKIENFNFNIYSIISQAKENFLYRELFFLIIQLWKCWQGFLNLHLLYWNQYLKGLDLIENIIKLLNIDSSYFFMLCLH